MANRNVFACLIGLFTLVTALTAGVLGARAATPNLVVDGNVAYQTVDGFGVNLNSAAWNQGNCQAAVDQLINQQGSSLWRVIVEQTEGWEETNDNADPNVFNWTYYDALYETPKFKALWSSLAYLRSKNQRLILSVMGYQPAWLGSPTLAKEEEWVEMIVSLLRYARHTKGIALPPVSPLNEMDLGYPEGPKQDAPSTLRLFQKLSARLDAVGMGDVQLIGPETAKMSVAASYTQALLSDPALMAKIKTFAYHDYSGGSDSVNATIANSDYPDRHWLMTEYAAWCSTCDEGGTGASDEWRHAKTSLLYLMQHLEAGANGACVYDALDTRYEHHEAIGYWGQLSYNATTGAYSPRKRFWALAQLHKFVRPGAVRIALPTNDTGANFVAFYDAATKQVTIVGLNRNGQFTLNGSLAGLPAISTLRLDLTDSDTDMQRQSDVPVTAGSFSVTIPADTIFTLTGSAARDTTPPTAPTGLTATAAAPRRVNLAWNAATDNVAVTAYNVWRNGVRLAGTSARTYADITVQPKTTYTYAVTAQDAAGNVSAKSGEKSVTTPADPDTAPPSVPTGLTATAAAPRRVNLAWNAATDNVAVTAYNVWRNGVRLAGTSARTYADITVQPKTTYTYAVTAQDAAGNISAKSGEKSVTTPADPDTTPPSVPTGLTATAAAPRRVNLAWNAATDNVAVTAYNVWRNGVRIAGTTGRTYADTNVQPKTTYTYAITSQDAAGNVSAKSGEKSVTTPADPDTTPPTAPTGLTATAASPRKVNLSWSAATDNVAVTAYNIWRNDVRIAGATVTTYSDTTVQPSTTYVYAVTAQDAAGNVSAKSAAKSVTTPSASDSTPPTAPSALGGEAVTAYKVNLAWKAATDNVGVTAYNIWRSGSRIAGTDARSYSDTTALPGTTYTYFVTAEDAAGNLSPKSNSISITTPKVADTTPPTAPSGLTAQAKSPTKVDLAWTAATDNVGVTAYNVWRNNARIAGTASLAYSDSSVQANTTYTYYVTAQDARGNVSPKSNVASATTPKEPDTTPPSAPTGLTALAASPTKVDLSWDAATDNVAVTAYNVLRNDVRIGGTSARSFSDSTVQPSTTYTYTVTAQDAAGNVGPKSSTKTVTTPAQADKTPPTAPQDLSANAASPTQVDLTWTAAADDAGVTAYNVWRNGSRIAGTSERTFSDTAVEPDTEYRYHVTAQDAAGNVSAKSNVVTVTTPDAPTGLYLDTKVSTHQTTPENAISSPPLSTSMSGELILACLGTDGPENGTISFSSVTGGGLTWTLRKRVNSQHGSSEIWQAVAQQRLSGVVVTATRSSGNWCGSMTLLAFANADLGRPGATGGASAPRGAAKAKVTTTRPGSIVIGVGNDWDGAVARTLSGRQEKVDEFLAPIGDTFWVQSLGPVKKKGTAATIKTLAPVENRWNLAVVEVRKK